MWTEKQCKLFFVLFIFKEECSKLDMYNEVNMKA
jgi:hypothetical protein